ncbi:sucrose-phosphate phosphatase [Aulosira sp. FACHB-615]|uniref:sucrose-phosphate phosphatase n=1 Tax=Aulosira sp. FACHB-615 TaxID=2692777 RepID=UPI001685EC99|nr:sucrose-phosphate phosphatase [Aulosira sp. FACHB-615]MBD2490221.1 sucrose-phosphate phosphatase [Aulosira sp. FACHB-615]
MKQFLLITDLDYTLVGDDDAMAQLNQQLDFHRQQYGTKVVYSTGRSPFLYQELASEKKLLEPDILVCSVGTEIYINGSQDPDSTWADKLSQAWDRNLVKTISATFTELQAQAESEQRDFKVSYFLDEKIAGQVVPELERALLEQGLDIQVIYSGGQDVDILPRHANKGMAMTFVRQHLEIDVTKTVACGDSGNDIALFAHREEKGIIVGNARPELLDWHNANPNPNRYLATAKFANAITEGLQHFGFLE